MVKKHKAHSSQTTDKVGSWNAC